MHGFLAEASPPVFLHAVDGARDRVSLNRNQFTADPTPIHPAATQRSNDAETLKLLGGSSP